MIQDLQFLINDNNTFGCRVSAIIVNLECNKILLYQIKGRDEWITPGGRIQFNETSSNALKRELKEELDFEAKELSFIGLIEEFGHHKFKKIQGHQLSVFYKVIYDKEIIEEFDGIEGDYCHFKWVDIKDIDNYIVKPEMIKEMVKDLNKIYHFEVNNDKKVRIATRCFLIKDNKIVSIKYKNKKDVSGYYDLPGGKIEDGENAFDCGKRECIEETGLVAEDFKYSGNLIIEYPQMIFDFSILVSDKFNGELKSSEENSDVEILDIDELIKQDKKLGSIKLLEKEYINDVLNCTNFKYKIMMDDNQNILSIEKIEE